MMILVENIDLLPNLHLAPVESDRVGISPRCLVRQNYSDEKSVMLYDTQTQTVRVIETLYTDGPTKWPQHIPRLHAMGRAAKIHSVNQMA